MKTQLATIACIAILMGIHGVNAQGQQQRVPEAIQKLRAPLTSLSLKDIFTNMHNPNTVTFYTNCVIGETSCDRIGAALRHFLVDLRPGQDVCFGCTKCERERLQYVLDTILEKYPKHACTVQTTLGKPIFGGNNPCA